MDLYSELSKDQYRGMIAGRIVGIGHSYERAAKEHIARRTEQARASGQIITGYRPLEFGYYRSDRVGRLDVPIFGQDPSALVSELETERARLAGIEDENKKYRSTVDDLQKQLKILQDVPKYEPYDFSAERKEYEDRISGLNTKIGDIQTGFQTQLEDTTAKMSAERAAAEQRLGQSFQSQLQASQNEAAQRQQQLTDQYKSSLQASQTRPEVAGVRFATRGPAARSRMQGISGTFGRKGSRLMKISALNV